MVHIDAIKDNYEIAQVKLKSPRSGVFYVGGGTPKNYISQVEVIQEVLGHEENPHWYAVQITTDVPQWGGLSGCTFEESQSWGKFQKEAKMAQSLGEASNVPLRQRPAQQCVRTYSPTANFRSQRTLNSLSCSRVGGWKSSTQIFTCSIPAARISSGSIRSHSNETITA